MHFQKIDWILITVCVIVLLLLALITQFTPGNLITLFFIIYSVILLVVCQIEMYRRTQIHLLSISYDQKSNYYQTECLFSVFSSLKNQVPLPMMRGWSISPDFAKLVIASIYEYKPKTIVELGSGVSTIISSYCLQSIDNGSVISIDHDHKYAKDTENNLAIHGLSNIAKVIYAPLKTITLDNQTSDWYDLEKLDNIQSIDLLIIDGPPVNNNSLARYPALPILYKALNDNAIILIDDANRIGEKKILDLWLQEFDDLEVKLIDAEKGAIILQKISTEKHIYSDKSKVAIASI